MPCRQQKLKLLAKIIKTIKIIIIISIFIMYLSMVHTELVRPSKSQLKLGQRQYLDKVLVPRYLNDKS